MSTRHIEVAPLLDLHRRDPFDRMLIAQASTEGLRLITADRTSRSYGIETVAATI